MIRAFAALLALVPALFAPATAEPRNDYARAAFTEPLEAGLRAFYTGDFAGARTRFAAALDVVPDNTLALGFLNAAAAHVPDAFDALVRDEEDALVSQPRSALVHLRLGFSYAYAGATGRDRSADARDELQTAAALDPSAGAPHVGLGILRVNERSANRAKVEFLAALAADQNDVLAREYLGLLYQVDLRDPQRALSYIINVPNLVPGYADIDFHIASVLYDLHQPKAAQSYATRALELDLDHTGEAGRYGLTLLARIYLEGKQLDDARRVLDASIAAGADAAYAKVLLDRLRAGDYGPLPGTKKS